MELSELGRVRVEGWSGEVRSLGGVGMEGAGQK